jgi:hypothetical protein
MLAVFVIWGLDTEGDAENPVFNLCWERFKRVGELLNLLIMKKLNFEKFNSKKVNKNTLMSIIGGGGTETGSGSVLGNAYSCDYYNSYSNGDREMIYYHNNGCKTIVRDEL